MTLVHMSVAGADDLKVLVYRWDEQIRDPKDVLDPIDEHMSERVGAQYEQEGMEWGGKWQQLSEPYATRKRRKYGEQPILQATGETMRSFTDMRHPDHIARAGRGFIEWGSQYEKSWPGAHQVGVPSRNLPKRQIVGLDKTDGQAIVEIMRDELLAKRDRRRAAGG